MADETTVAPAAPPATPASGDIRIDTPGSAPTTPSNETLLHLKPSTVQSLKDLGYSDQQIPTLNLHDVYQIVSNKTKAPESGIEADTRPWYKKLGPQAEAWWTNHPAYAGTLDAPGKSPEEKAADFGKGLAVGAAPALVVSGAEAPLMTATSVLTGLAGQEAGGAAGKKIGEKVGAPRLGEDVGAAVGGAAGAMAPGATAAELAKVRETGLAPTPAETAATEPVDIHMNRETVKKLTDLGYSNQQITNFNITDIRNIVNNNIPAPPVSPEAPVSAPAETAPAPEGSVEAELTKLGGKKVSAPEPVPDLVTAETTAPTITAKGPEWDRHHIATTADGEILGSVGYKTDPNGVAQMIGQYVHPEYRGQGVAQQLVRSAIDEAQKAGASSFTSDSTGISPEAMQVWQALQRKGLPIETFTYPNGTPGFKINFDNLPEGASAAVPAPEVRQTLAERGQLDGQKVVLTPEIGAKYVGGLENHAIAESQQARDHARAMADHYDASSIAKTEGNPELAQAHRDAAVAHNDAYLKHLTLVNQTGSEVPQNKVAAEEASRLAQSLSDKAETAETEESGTKPKTTSEKLVDKYGTTDDPLKAGFILSDGSMVPLQGEHDSMLKAIYPEQMTDRGYTGPLREGFIKDEKAVRTRFRTGRAGDELVFSVPASGVNEDQIAQMRQAVGRMGRNGTAVIEIAEPRGASTTKEFARPSDIEPMLKHIHAHPDQAGDITTSEKQSPLKEPYTVEVTDADGTRRMESIDAFSSKNAIATAQKKFPAANKWRIESFAAREPSTEYSVPTKKLAKMKASAERSEVQTIRHELGHAMVGLQEGLIQKGMVSSSAPGQPSNMRAGVTWSAADLLTPAGRLKPEKIPAAIRMMMGGIAADEAFNDVPRGANHNFINRSGGSDGQMAYQYLRMEGVSHDQALEYMHQAIDDAKAHLMQPMVADIIRENENVREEGLSRQYHYSPERLRNMHAEAQRRIQNAAVTEGPDNEAIDGENDRGREAANAAGEGGSASATAEVVPKEITTAEKAKPKQNPPVGYITPTGKFDVFQKGESSHMEAAHRLMGYGDPQKSLNVDAFDESLDAGYVRKAGQGSYQIRGDLTPKAKAALEHDIILDSRDLKTGGRYKRPANIVIEDDDDGYEFSLPDFLDKYNGDVSRAMQGGLDFTTAEKVKPKTKVTPEVSPNPKLQASAQVYAKEHDMPAINHEPVTADPARAKEIAKIYDEAKHNPNDPRVKAAYAALKAETLAQFHHLRDDLGLKFAPQDTDPYKSAGEMMNDIKKNNRLKVFTGSSTGEDHPLSEVAPGTGGATYNTVFRWVHDAMGHAAGGNDFSENGEKSATEAHAQMYSDTARPAMRAETEGQTSWFFHNPEVEAGRAQPGAFAEQKATTLPDVSHDWHESAGKMASENEAGGINPRTGKSDTRGIGTEIAPEFRQPLDHAPTAEDFKKFYDKHQELFDQYPELRVGWDNNSAVKGGHEINIGAVGPNAAKVAAKLDQKSAFDIAKGKIIPTGGTGLKTKFPDYPIEARIKDLGNGAPLAGNTGENPSAVSPTFTHKTFGIDDSIGRIDATNTDGESIGHVTYNLPDPTKRKGDFKATIAMASVDTPGQGIGQKLYLETAQQAKAKGARYLVSDTPHGVDQSAVRVWEKLMEKGYPVEKLGDTKYRMDLAKLPNADMLESKRAVSFGGTAKAPAAPPAPASSKDIPTVSTRVSTKTVKGATIEDHTNQALTSDMDAAKAAPGYMQKMVDKIINTPGFKAPEGGDANAIADAYIRHVADNIEFVFNKLKPENIKNDEQWYPVGAHQRGLAVAKEHGLTPAQAFGITSVESPMTDWDQNTSLAERTANIWKNQQNTKFTPEMQKATDKITSLPANAAFKPFYKSLKGKTLGELKTTEEQAHWLRLYDEAHNPREYQTWNPDGTSNGLARNQNGEPKKVSWSFQRHIEKAIEIAKDGSPENISKQLGYGHKVRNFYNNQIAPDDPRYLTIDTHAVNVGQLRPLSGYDTAVRNNFGEIRNGAYGLKGTYPLHDAGYRLAAKELGIDIPSRLQSPVWTKIRDVFTDDFKTKDNREAVDAIWKEHTDGHITADQARDRIWDYAERWNREAAGKVRNTREQGNLFEVGVRGEPATGSTGRGTESGATGAVSDEGDTSFNFGANVKPAAPLTRAEQGRRLAQSLKELRNPSKH